MKCVNCKKNAREGKVRCQNCQDAVNQRRFERFVERKARKICKDCKNVAVEGRVRCQNCLDAVNKRALERALEREIMKLSDTDKQQIRQSHEPADVLAKQFNCSPRMIGYIQNPEVAKHKAKKDRHREYMEGMRHPKMGGKTFSRPGGTTAKDVAEDKRSNLQRFLDGIPDDETKALAPRASSPAKPSTPPTPPKPGNNNGGPTKGHRKLSPVIPRKGQGKFHNDVRYYDQDECAICGDAGGPKGFLIAHHIIPWALGGANDPNNGIVVCPTCHTHLDAGYVKVIIPEIQDGTFQVSVSPNASTKMLKNDGVIISRAHLNPKYWWSVESWEHNNKRGSV